MIDIPPRFPSEREAKRAALLAAVESIRDVLDANVAENEESRTLAPAVVDALRESGLFALKIPEVLGGAEADPVVQMDIIAAVTRVDPAAGWCMFISSAVTGNASTRLPDQAVEQMFAGGRIPCMAGTLKPSGSARRVDGGYVVSGSWSWASGIRHADYVSTLCPCDDPKTVIGAVIPVDQVTIHDNWHVMGMKGTGSCDYSVDDVFVPDAWACDMANPPRHRGGALYRMGVPGYVVNEHASFAIALARTALDAVVEAAAEHKRGYVATTTTADRQIFQRAVAEGTLRLNACWLQMCDTLERMFAAAEAGQVPPLLQAEGRAMAVLCTDEAIDVAAKLFRYAGGRAVYLDDRLQRVLRDLYTVQSHLVVSDAAYEDYGQLLLGVSNRTHLMG